MIKIDQPCVLHDPAVMNTQQLQVQEYDMLRVRHTFARRSTQGRRGLARWPSVPARRRNSLQAVALEYRRFIQVVSLAPSDIFKDSIASLRAFSISEFPGSILRPSRRASHAFWYSCIYTYGVGCVQKQICFRFASAALELLLGDSRPLANQAASSLVYRSDAAR